MSPKEQLAQEELLAPFLVLLIGKLTGWTQPTHIGGDPTYLTGEQTAALAAEGIDLLASFLPQEAAQRVTSAVERLPRPPRGTREERLLSVGALGGVIHSAGGDGAPGCCVEINGHLFCVR
jgi:hypothetical protein